MNQSLLLVAICALSTALPSVATADSAYVLQDCSAKFTSKSSGLAACRKCIKSNEKEYTNDSGRWACITYRGKGPKPGMKLSGPVRAEDTETAPKATRMPDTFSKFATIPAGSFTIGATSKEIYREGDELQSVVTLTRSFKMKTTEVTVGEWTFLMGTSGNKFDKTCKYDCPVTNVTFPDTLEFLNRASKNEKLEQCYDLTDVKKPKWTKGLACEGYRLPTEAEWEYAARAGVTDSAYGERDEIAWHKGNASTPNAGGGNLHVQPVGKKKPNAWGLYDMLGNATEWCWDEHVWLMFEKPSTDPIGGGLTALLSPNEDTHITAQRIRRGSGVHGLWPGQGEGFRFASRKDRMIPDSSTGDTGFRPVQTVKTAAK